jgi:hypothetical protein
MKWYKKQIDQLKKLKPVKDNNTSKKTRTTGKPFHLKQTKANKIIIHSGMEKRSRDKTDAIS